MDAERLMTLPKPYFQSTAQRLIEEATTGCDDPAAIASATERVFQRLHEHLSRLIGMVGWRTLLARALKLARAWLPALERVEVMPDGQLAGLVEALDPQSRDDALAAPTALLAQLLDLLAAFVGDDLALHLVGQATRSAPEPGGPRGVGDEGSIDTGRSEQR